ncbi:MAG: AI-2E family transporter [Rhodospirillaceae bacterium]|nr:MAG: AI-2E family transporter [Rhodospirillaceae bacterium]
MRDQDQGSTVFATDHLSTDLADHSLKYNITAWILMGIGLFLVLYLGLLTSLLPGLLVYELVQMAGIRHRSFGVTYRAGKVIALSLLATFVTLLLLLAIGSVAIMITDRSDSPFLLLQKMADIIDAARIHFPPWAQHYLPANVEDLRATASDWLRVHASDLRQVGENFGRIFVRILIGMIIGGMIAISTGIMTAEPKPLGRAMRDRLSFLGTAFRRVVFAQVRISALNTIFTGIYLIVLLPFFGVDLPLKKTMIAVTFMAGLIPVIGNLISNTIIVIVSLSASFLAAAGSLVFLVLIHKLEYFINARIIGTQIRARAWELLLAMLVMEAAFGIPGVIAAPIFYAYIKDELSVRNLI